MTQVEMLRLFILKTSWEMDRIVAECQSSKAQRAEVTHGHLVGETALNFDPRRALSLGRLTLRHDTIHYGERGNHWLIIRLFNSQWSS
jgi:hypothetical protein